MIRSTLLRRRFPGRAWFAALGLLLGSAFFVSAAPTPGPGATLVVNGDFDHVGADRLPAGWSAPKPEGTINVVREGSLSYLRLVSTAPNQLVLVTQTVAVPEGWKGLVVKTRFRTENVKFGKDFLCDARARFSFRDASGKPVGKGPPDIIFSAQAKNWTEAERKFLVPESAVALKIDVCLNRPASGALDLDSIRVVAMDPAEAEALAMAPILAARKKAADEEAVRDLLALPPITRPLKVSGNRLVDDRGRHVILRGVNVPSLEWSSRGENVLRSTKVAVVDWQANVIRLPVHNRYWFGRGKGKEPANDAEAYRALVDDVVKIAAARGAWVILDLHLFGSPQADAVEFWQDAAARYKNHPAVLFDLFNEPTSGPWELWRKGGPKEVKDKKTGAVSTIEVVGMQTLIDTVRATGAKNIVIAGGLAHAYDLSGVLEGHALSDTTGNGLVYATHFYNWHRGWERKFLSLASRYPILVGEFGADVKKMNFIPAAQQEDPHTWMPDALGMIQKYQLNWTAFSLHPAATPVLIKDWTYEPTPFFGAFVKDALAGKRFESTRLR